MNKKEVVSFLEKFDVSSSVIEKFFDGKKIINRDQNVFLCEEDFNGKKKYCDILLFIKLRVFLVSSFLLKFISENCMNLVEVKNEQSALHFTYGKNLSFENVKCRVKVVEGKNYIVLYSGKILGICSLDKKDRKFPLKNEMNIGEYLRES